MVILCLKLVSKNAMRPSWMIVCTDGHVSKDALDGMMSLITNEKYYLYTTVQTGKNENEIEASWHFSLLVACSFVWTDCWAHESQVMSSLHSSVYPTHCFVGFLFKVQESIGKIVSGVLI